MKTDKELKQLGVDVNSPLQFDPTTNFQVLDMWRDKKNNDDAEQFTKLQRLETNLKQLGILVKEQELELRKINDVVKKLSLPKVSQLEVEQHRIEPKVVAKKKWFNL